MDEFDIAVRSVVQVAKGQSWTQPSDARLKKSMLLHPWGFQVRHFHIHLFDKILLYNFTIYLDRKSSSRTKRSRMLVCGPRNSMCLGAFNERSAWN